MAKNLLIVLSYQDHLGNTGEKTGFPLKEFAPAYLVLKDASAAITKVNGDAVPSALPRSNSSPILLGRWTSSVSKTPSRATPQPVANLPTDSRPRLPSHASILGDSSTNMN